jgi:hypothetical protein
VANTSDLQQIGDHPRHDWLLFARPLIGPSVAKKGHDCCNARGAGAAAGIGESQKFDQVIVDWRRSRLHEEDLLATHRVEQLHGNIAVRIPIYDAGTKLSVQLARHRCRQ